LALRNATSRAIQSIGYAMEYLLASDFRSTLNADLPVYDLDRADVSSESTLNRTVHRHPGHAEWRMMLQKLPSFKAGSLSAMTSPFTLPNVVAGLFLIPS
jgi:hypothetical protein